MFNYETFFKDSRDISLIIDFAKKQSDENPISYLQNTHARVSSIIRMKHEEDLNQSLDNPDLLTGEVEQNLLKIIRLFSKTILFSAENYEPNSTANYLENCQRLFVNFTQNAE